MALVLLSVHLDLYLVGQVGQVHQVDQMDQSCLVDLEVLYHHCSLSLLCHLLLLSHQHHP